MTKASPPAKSAATDEVHVAQENIALLRAEAEGLRAQLADLRDKLAVAERDLDATRLPPLTDPRMPVATPLVDADSGNRLRHLLEANERLVVAALEAQDEGSRALEANLRQIKFMAMVAHELRDPLAPIRTAADLLNRLGNNGGVQLSKVQDIIKRQVNHISRLVEDLLDGSRVSMGTFRLRSSTIDARTVIKLAVETCQPDLNVRQQTLTLGLADTPLTLHGDPVRLAQVFINLLENASKYTQEGGAIALSAALRDGVIVATISDNGIGIAADMLPHVFDLFVQEPGVRARRNGGLGIGLAVVRELIQAHGGTVAARSAGRNMGSEFVVTVPIGNVPGDRER